MTNLRKYGDLFIDRNFSIYAHTIFYEMINNQLIDHSDSLLITFRNIILDKFRKCIDVKERKDQTESVQRIRI